MITTESLKLIPSTAEMLRAEINDPVELAQLLTALVPNNWPPETTVDALPFFLDCVESSSGQDGWYALNTKTNGNDPANLIGGGGFMGPPKNGTVQLGYSVIDQHQRKGYATEIVGGLIRWAFRQSGCLGAIAETEWSNPASARVLAKNSFVSAGPASTPGGTRFELTAPTSV